MELEAGLNVELHIAVENGVAVEVEVAVDGKVVEHLVEQA